MSDNLKARPSSDAKRTAPGTRAREVEFGSSDEDYTTPFGATVYVGVLGDLKITPSHNNEGNSVTLQNVQGWIPISVRAIHADGTTAEGIVITW